MRIILPLRAPTVLRAGVATSRTERRDDPAARQAASGAPSGRGPATERSSQVRRSDAGPRGARERRRTADRRRGDPGVLSQLDRAGTAGGGCQHRRPRPVLVHGPADSSRTLRFVYNGTAGDPACAAGGHAARPRRLDDPRRIDGGSSTARQFGSTGRVRSLPTPPAGKLVELQVVLSGRWQTFRTTTTDADGRGACSTASGAAAGSSATASGPVFPPKPATRSRPGVRGSSTVRVRGRPCR